MTAKLITIMTPCYNEVLNVREVHRRVMAMASQLPEYRFEHLFVDNASKDGTVDELRKVAAEDPSVKGDCECAQLWRRPFGNEWALAGAGECRW